MIGRLTGILLEKSPPELLLDVNGVGYEIQAPMTSFYQLPEIGARVTLHTHLVVREDAHLLFGFSRLEERTLFRSLLKVSGVGAKMALAILSSMSPDQFALCIAHDDSASLTRIPGVGKKTAERLVVEMRDRLSDWQYAVKPAVRPAGGSTAAAMDPRQDAISALQALGYKPAEVSKMVQAVDEEGLSAEEIIRRALQSVSKY
jgi:Holliday junction DNA helicase RuvA